MATRKHLAEDEEPAEPMTEEERLEVAIKNTLQRVHAGTSAFASRLRRLIDDSSLSNDDKKPFLDLVRDMYAYGEDASSL